MTLQRTGLALPAPFPSGPFVVRPEWIDDNGHLNLAYYIVLFDWATDALWQAIGIGDVMRAAGFGTFAAETHTLYRAELLQDQPVTIGSQILAADSKRLRAAYTMRREGIVVCQQELMYLCVDLGTRRVAPWPERFATSVKAAAAAHAALPVPEWVGRRVAMPSRA